MRSGVRKIVLSTDGSDCMRKEISISRNCRPSAKCREIVSHERIGVAVDKKVGRKSRNVWMADKTDRRSGIGNFIGEVGNTRVVSIERELCTRSRNLIHPVGVCQHGGDRLKCLSTANKNDDDDRLLGDRKFKPPKKDGRISGVIGNEPAVLPNSVVDDSSAIGTSTKGRDKRIPPGTWNYQHAHMTSLHDCRRSSGIGKQVQKSIDDGNSEARSIGDVRTGCSTSDRERFSLSSSTRSGKQQVVAQQYVFSRSGIDLRTVRKMTPGPLISKLRGRSKEENASEKAREKFVEECLVQHNLYRKKHGAPHLKKSKELCRYALEWAEELLKNNKFEHRSPNKYGESIYMKSSSDVTDIATGKDATDSWYSEVKDYTSYGQEPSGFGAGHFTQVVWKSSTEFGVGMATENGRSIVVANYNPPGNVRGQYADNVLKPK